MNKYFCKNQNQGKFRFRFFKTEDLGLGCISDDLQAATLEIKYCIKGLEKGIDDR